MARLLNSSANSAAIFTESAQSYVPPIFLAPSLLPRPFLPYKSSSHHPRPFSSTHQNHGMLYKQKDGNRKRGVSAIRRTGPKTPLAMQKYPLPQPVTSRPAPKENSYKDHGLMGFFPSNGKAMATPDAEGSHGRSWTYLELATKNWEDLHRLYWVCLKERNRIATTSLERDRVKAGFGQYEADNRDRTIRRTQIEIRRVLANRWHSWNRARDLWQKGYWAEQWGEETNASVTKSDFPMPSPEPLPASSK